MLYELSAGLPMSEWAELWAGAGECIRAYTRYYILIERFLAEDIDFNNFKI